MIGNEMKLLEQGRIGQLILKNRVIMSGMGCGALVNLDGTLSQRGIDYYVERAKGGVSMVTTGSVRVTRDFERPPGPLSSGLMLDNKLYGRWVHELSQNLHDYGTKLCVQLSAGLGRCLSKGDIKLVEPIGPSANPCLQDPKRLTRPLTIAEINQLINAFESAAEICRSTGADAIELNCHAGYLVDQFMTPLWNRRDDQYGGNLENRLRFLTEIVARVKRAAGPRIPLIVKYALTHYLDGGRLPEEGVEIARMLEAAGVDALTIDAGARETQYWTLPSEFLPEGCNVDLAEMVKQAVSIPVIAVGKLGDPHLAEETLTRNQADFIALGRTLIADPHWVSKVREGRTKDICPCVDCFEGCHKHIHDGKPVGCAVNPSAGNERALQVAPAELRKRVFVIGAGPGGLEAARVASLRGHEVHLLEKEAGIGGNIDPGSSPPFKTIYRRLTDYLMFQLTKQGVTIEFGHEARAADLIALNPDAVILATGSAPIVPPIEGVNLPHVVIANDVLTGKSQASGRIAIIGGGVVGCETALHLARLGHDVMIIERMKDLAPDMYYINRMHMLKLLADEEVKVELNADVRRIEAHGLTYETAADGLNFVPADSVVIAAGFRSRTKLAQDLDGHLPEVYSIGDSISPRKVMEAMNEGYRIARLI
ncbi:2,4-dienoyl-CoA reductase (NADPH) [Rhizobium sp. CF080]|uniref:FAD-dependent oxidoreductase n=1 Tax=Rhizobium sp. (strain CF080) TaxID=1144310 RepID=UPI00027188B5|nr:FAD-dependent oxidoreductase [Rhizobium sp. CF080]EUB99299.1 2,4-dienoyl-CoA reductase (NADPH) [Rhizobium sp. CF080]